MSASHAPQEVSGAPRACPDDYLRREMKQKILVKYPLWISLIIFCLLTLALLSTSFMRTHGHIGYPLDDTYIHMAIGKHFVNDGFWGISANGFSSSTSSPLWTLLIALTYRLLGVNDWTPVALGLISGSLAIIICYHLLRKNTNNALRLTIFLALIILFTPLPILALTGMEHGLHGFLTVGLVYHAATLLTKSESNSRPFALLLILSGLLTMTRYEGLFLVFSIALLLITRKRFFAAFWTVAAGLLPVMVYGFYSLALGWYFLPNSIFLKGNVPVFTLEGMSHFFLSVSSKLNVTPHILVLVIACLGIYLWCDHQGVSGEKERYLITLFVLMTLSHLQFAYIGEFYRYEAYLVLTGSLILVDMVISLISVRSAKAGNIFNFGVVFVLGVFVIMPLAFRTGRAFREYPIAITNIYEQQYQMGIFLQKYYSGKAIAANDMGAINYLADIKTLDLFGIGSMEVAQAKRNGLYDKDVIGELVSRHHIEIVMIYTDWFEENLPPEWIEIGAWQIADKVVTGGDTVSFYAPGASWEEDVTAHLKDFSDQLPSTVNQSGRYTAP
ncbi:MAG TPA: glycosyltransferase family 39 protein [Anaerolineales bacterium]|nr:glycosyltransferase family 39 protein [Anaerolineales bacterium]